MNKNTHRNTKIVATVGPASSSYEALLDLARAGVNVFRLNFSHGSHSDHQEVIERITYINNKYRFHAGILADLQGPKIRIGKIKEGTLVIKPGDHLVFTTHPVEGTREAININYQDFPQDVNIGDRILLSDGKVVCKVLETNKTDAVYLEVIHGSELSSNKGVNLPDTKLSLPSLTPKDLSDLDFILTQPVNWIALSFVRSPKDVKDLKARIEERGHKAKVISKIEKPEAIHKIDKIIKLSNGVMIARGDLGIEVPMEQLPNLQKMIISKCIQRARPVIVATQLMLSMIENPSPTRAEITDVANAVLDGTDAVMLSEETAIGNHPVRVVNAMIKIIHEAEKIYKPHDQRPKASPKSSTYSSDVMCISAGKIADEIKAKAIVGLTISGYTAFKISSYRPHTPIMVFSDREHMLATMSLTWGTRCFYYNKFTSTDETIEDLNNFLKKHFNITTGDYIVNTGAMPLHKRLRTNFCKITTVD